MRFSEILNERLGTLAQLNLGPFVELLKTQYNPGWRRGSGRDVSPSVTGIGSKFTDNNSYSRIGSNSEIIDIGQIKKGMSDLRRAFKQRDEDFSGPKGFALYLDNKTIMFGIIEADAIRKANPQVLIGYDFRGTTIEAFLTKREEEENAANKDKWGYHPKVTPRLSHGAFKTHEENPEATNWRDRNIEIMNPVIGSFMTISALADLVNLMAKIAKDMGSPLTAKLVMSDKQARKKIDSRDKIKRELQNTGDDLKMRLIKFKNDKQPTAETIQEFIDMAMQKQAKIVQFNGVAYQTELSDYYGEIKPKHLFGGKPIRINYESAKGALGSLYISFVYDIMTGRLVPIEAEYSGEKVILDDKLWLKTRVGKVDKKVIIPILLKYIKADEFKTPTLIITVLKRQSIDWPELDTIQKSINIEMAKKK